MMEKENEENFENKILDKIEEVEEAEIQSVKIIEEKKKDEYDRYAFVNSEEYIRFNLELQAKNDLVNTLENLAAKLKEENNKKKNINEIYEIYLKNEFISKSHIRKNISKKILKFMIFFIGPLFSIIFLIGIFQVKSLMNALFGLIKKSVINYYNCNFHSNCNITITNDGTNEFDFYNYYYEYSMDETIDINLMMITGFIGNLIIKITGFEFGAFILCLFNFGAFIWLLNFDFNFSKKGIFDYDLLKIINIILIYALLLLGLGGSALLSNQLLVESHLKFKDYLLEKIRDKSKVKKQKEEELQEIKDNNKKNKILKSVNTGIKELNLDKPIFLQTKTMKSTKSIKELLEKEIEEIEEKKLKDLEEKLDKRKKNKFDFFFMICLTTIFGYLGKYSMNLLLNYDKRIFLFYIMGLYGISLIFSILLYFIFRLVIYENDQKDGEKEGKKIIKICQICGYLIYSEKKQAKITQRNCCCLCWESFQNCCNQTFCYFFSVIGCDELCSCFDYCCCCGCCMCCYCCNCCDICCECCECDCECYDDFRDWRDDPHCDCSICKNCRYNQNDYRKNEDAFLYCYKVERKCQSCNKFVTNSTQKKIFPFMLLYFVLQLTTIGFEKQYEKYKNLNTHRKSFVAIFISTFILFFYFTLSCSRLISQINDEDLDSEKKEDDKKTTKLGMISKLSNEILNGTLGILMFNCLFSFIFSIFYLSYMSEEVKSFLFKDNINIIFIPILMNKFYYFTLNYYCIYTAEEDKKFEIISGSSLISFYILIWSLFMTLVKLSIPDDSNGYDYFNILYIIQIIFSSLPTLLGSLFLLLLFIYSLGIVQFLDACDCASLIFNFNLHKYLFIVLSYIICFGGLWIKIADISEFELEYECNCCDIGDNCCNVYCIDNAMFCDCSCCDRNSSCFSIYCYKNCNSCEICCCHRDN